MFPAIGSTIIAAISSLFCSNKAFTSSKLLYSANNVSFAVPCVTPGEFGFPKVAAPEPALIKNESECPW